MPRYFFDIRDSDSTVTDSVGLDLPDLEAAIREAQRALHEMATDKVSDAHTAFSLDIREGDRSLVTVTTSTSVVPGVQAVTLG